MKTITIFLISLTISITSCYYHHQSQKKTYLTQKDFENGSYIIKTPGTYILKQNIIFNPPKRVPISLLRTNPSFHLGFFAAIIIQTKNITLDLNNFSIIQSDTHYLNQRFYSHIELGSSPFVPKTGPHDFTDNFLPARGVIIKNGVLGLSSHHGIHGNNCEDVIVKDLEIRDFEVAGVSVNGAKNFKMENCVVGPSSEKVMVNGLFSTAKFIEGFVEAVVRGKEECGGIFRDTFLFVRGRNLNSKVILRDLRKLIKDTQSAFLSRNFMAIPEILRNKSGLPDGSSLYGILFHSEKPAVGGFNNNYEKNNMSSNITLKNIIIKDLVHKTHERIVLQKEGEKKKENFQGGQIDPRGSFFNILDFTDKSGNYISNPIGNAQLLVSKYKKCLYSKKKILRKKRIYHTNTKRNSISKKVLYWAGALNNSPLKAKYICNGDQMLHSIKGTIPLRLSGISQVNLKNIKIKNIKNKSPFGSKLCGNYRATTSLKNSKPGYLGADIRGISIESCNEIKMKKITINKLTSKSGNVIGIDIMFKNKGIKGEANIHDLETVKWKDLPEDFNLVPQSTPFSTPIFISNDSLCFLNVNTKKLVENGAFQGNFKVKRGFNSGIRYRFPKTVFKPIFRY